MRAGKLRLKGAAGVGLRGKRKKSKRKRECQEGEKDEALRHGGRRTLVESQIHHSDVILHCSASELDSG